MLGKDIIGVEAVELEWVKKPPRDPASLFGESGGKRRANQTSPEIAFVVRLRFAGSSFRHAISDTHRPTGALDAACLCSTYADGDTNTRPLSAHDSE